MFLGKKEFSKTIGEGRFYCPECRCTTAYLLKQKKMYFAFFKLPLRSLRELFKYVECQGCKNHFMESVVETHPERSREEFHPLMKRIMVLMMVTSGRIDDAEIEAIKEIYEKVSGLNITREEILEDVKTAVQDKSSVSEYLKRVTPYLNMAGKEQLFKSAYYVAAADGVFQDEEKLLLKEISEALDMEPAHYQGVLSELIINSEDACGSERVLVY